MDRPSVMKAVSVGSVYVLSHPIIYPLTLLEVLAQAKAVRAETVRQMIGALKYISHSGKKVPNLYRGGLTHMIETLTHLTLGVLGESLFEIIPRKLSQLQHTLMGRTPPLESPPRPLYDTPLEKLLSLMGFILSFIITCPLDVIKTRQICSVAEGKWPTHASTTSSPLTRPPTSIPTSSTPDIAKRRIHWSLMGKARHIIAEEGVAGLYSGWSVGLVRAVVNWGFMYLSNYYEQMEWEQVRENDMRRRMAEETGTPHEPVAYSSKNRNIKTGLVVTRMVLDYILSVIKIRCNIRDTGLMSYLRSIIKNDGPKGLITGWQVHMYLFLLWLGVIMAAGGIMSRLANRGLASLSGPGPAPDPETAPAPSMPLPMLDTPLPDGRGPTPTPAPEPEAYDMVEDAATDMNGS
eukprot:TRINITY_DN7994_c0_g1_i1.p1 TRINITY_DN7994_c0_g1~~TRINITY_DN7994_c0_g1_i1.p1  ORF type:complete len:406 (-),score=68.64 TRINITY_DN7994_c0_g1_i1:12-1229(-)